MDKKMRSAVITCCAIAITTTAVVISAFTGTPVSDRSTPVATSSQVSLYESAVDMLQKQTNLSMTVMQTKVTTINGDRFSEESTQEICFTGLGTEDMRGSVDQKLIIGPHIVSSVELYAKNTGYFTVQEVPFRGSISPEAYLARYVPSTPITPSLYKTVTTTKAGETTILTFADATGPESWLDSEIDQFQSAGGTAHLDKDGNLTRSEFNVTYSKNGMQIHSHIVVKINDNSHIKVNIPKDTDKYTKIQHLDAPLELEVVCGYLMIADAISASYTNKTTHQAYGDIRTEQITLNVHKGNTWSARIDTDIDLSNTSLGDAGTTVSQTESFIDDKYTVTLDGITEELPLDEASMKTLCRDQLVGTILLPQYIKSAKISKGEKNYRIEITPTASFANLIRADISHRLYQESDESSEKYKTSKLTCYLDLDVQKHMPVESGIFYEGTYKKDGITYTISSDTVQKYDIVSTTAYDAIHNDK